MIKPILVWEGWYTVEDLRNNPDKVFVFGDNLKGYGKAGQAIIRDEPNAFGIPTKRYPSKDEWAYFSDKLDEEKAVTQALRVLYVLAQSKTIVFPEDGIGTGLARMSKKSPLLFDKMSHVLKRFFFFENNAK
jgi:hypothetical protein